MKRVLRAYERKFEIRGDAVRANAYRKLQRLPVNSHFFVEILGVKLITKVEEIQ